LFFTYGVLFGYAYKVHKIKNTQNVKQTIAETKRQLEQDILEEKPKAEFIELNPVKDYLKENDNRPISIGEIIK